MSRYCYTAAKPTRVMLERKWEALLRATAQYKSDRRDHLLFSMARGTGLGEQEIAQLNVDDVFKFNGRARMSVRLPFYKGQSKTPFEYQEIRLDEKLRRKLNDFYRWKLNRGEDTGPDAPLFVCRLKKRISTLIMHHLVELWQDRIEVERTSTPHGLRPAAVNDFAKREGDWEAARIFARHKDIRTTRVYPHLTSEELNQMV